MLNFMTHFKNPTNQVVFKNNFVTVLKQRSKTIFSIYKFRCMQVLALSH